MNRCIQTRLRFAAFAVLLTTVPGWFAQLEPTVSAEDDYSLLFRGGTSECVS